MILLINIRLFLQKIYPIIPHNKFIQVKKFMLKLAKIDSIQKKINQYTYANTDTIGKGFSSQVYKDEQVAIKIIDMKFIKGQIHKNLLTNEIQILKLLKNIPNILQFYDVFSIKNNTCIITQLCEGGDLSKTLKSKKVLTQNQAVLILKQIINGYRGIYRYGIIHRDLKPANLFFVNGKIKIADFGFAVKQSNIKKESSYNVGSPVYMPLQALNQNIYSFKSDIWAIGVIFYQMLAGKTPWRAKTQNDLKRQIKNNPIKTLLPPNISPQSQQFLKRTLQLNAVLRMSPEELIKFFTKSQIENDEEAVQKTVRDGQNLFMTQKRPVQQFRTRAISNEKDDRLPKNQTHYGKYQLNFDVTTTEKKKGFLKGLGQTGMNFDSLGRTTATMGKKTESNFYSADPKKQFEYLISQVHFCRFLYKLIDRINKSVNVDFNKKLRIKMTSLIFQKLKETSFLKGMELRARQYFRQSHQYSKLVSIINQYEEKYQQSLDEYINQDHDFNRNQDLSEAIIKEIQTLFTLIESTQNPQSIADEVILLDYLITCKQLLYILQNSSLSEFHAKAKIQAIVNGKPTKNITDDHIRAIKEKLKSMKLV